MSTRTCATLRIDHPTVVPTNFEPDESGTPDPRDANSGQ